MATRRSRASLPNFLLELIDDIPEESGSSDEEFDVYLGPDDGPVTFASGHSVEDYDSGTTLARSRSLNSLTELEREQTESPLHTPAPPTPLHIIYCALCIHYLSAQPPLFSVSPGVVLDIERVLQ